MTTAFLVRENHSYSHSSSLNANRKKIKHYSYSLSDKIGKGFSSIVYKGTNDHTSTPPSTQMKSSPSRPST